MAALTATSIQNEGPKGLMPTFGAGNIRPYTGQGVRAEGNHGLMPTLGARSYGYSPYDIVTIVGQYGAAGGGVSLF